MNHFSIAKEEMAFYGEDCTSLQNLLAILIGPKADPYVTGKLAALGVRKLGSMSKQELISFEGIGEVIASRIFASIGLGNLFLKQRHTEEQCQITSPEDAAKYLSDLMLYDQEHFDVLYLNTKNVIIGRKNIFKGSLNSCIVHPREVLHEAIKLNAASMICGHQHPSGSPYPTNEDIEVTKRLAECGKTMGIELLDHVVIGANGRYCSLKDRGYL